MQEQIIYKNGCWGCKRALEYEPKETVERLERFEEGQFLRERERYLKGKAEYLEKLKNCPLAQQHQKEYEKYETNN